MKSNENMINEYSKYASHLGNFNPYYSEENKSELFMTIEEALSQVEKCYIDEAGIVEIVGKSYLFGNRTLIKGIKRVPWITSFNNTYKPYDLAKKLPEHKNITSDIGTVHIKLKSLLKEELQGYLENKKVVGILLSGGLDSRILAGLIKELQNEELYSGKVVAFTWGLSNSRDVIYSKEICKRFDWDIEHIVLTPEILLNNIYLAGKFGAEYSPYHLHAMHTISNYKSIDAIIAGSYGDSVGRGEFSGRKLRELKPLIPQNIDPFGVIRCSVLREVSNIIENDAFEYKKHIKRLKDYQYYEVEQELHYMRRKLNACMNVIGHKIPLYQLFTKPESFELMWSLDPDFRNDNIYKKILLTLPNEIGLIPWARDSKNIFGEENELLKGEKQHHKYGEWLRKDLNKEIKELVLSNEIEKLNIFNICTLKNIVKVWENQKTETISSLDELIAWLASLAVFVKEYNIEIQTNKPTIFKDRIKCITGPLRAYSYSLGRSLLRD